MATVNGSANGYHGTGEDTRLRLPPQNLDAELSVIGSMLIDSDVVEGVLAIVGPGDFFRGTHQTIVQAIAALHGRGEPVDCVTLAEELTRRGRFEELGGDDLLAELVESVGSSASALHHAQIVRQKSLQRQLATRALDVLDQVYSNNHTAEELLETAQQSLAEIGEPIGAAGDESFSLRPWPDDPDPAIWHGLAGDIVYKIAPETEADPVAILGQFLAAFGNIVGRKPHWRVDASRHSCNLFLAIVGNSAKARKGTSWDIVSWLLRGCDPEWRSHRILSGLSSGEGMIWSVRDQIMRREKQGTLFLDVCVDPGVDDKRALFVESEFGSTLAVLNREGNTLSGYIRKAWDSGELASTVKNNPARATGAHISIIAHITAEELHRRLTQTDAANGFANRFLWICARRARYLPEGGRISKIDWSHEERRLRDAVDFAKGELESDDSFVVVRDAEARELWHEAYPSLSDPKPGLFGAVVSRAEAQVMRLAMIYALLDQSSKIRAVHLKAALALWRYCEQSAAYCFGESMGVPNADKVLSALEAAGDEGLLRTEILRRVFHGRQPREPLGGIDEILGSLARAGLAEFETVATKGRPAMRWRRVRKHAPCDLTT